VVSHALRHEPWLYELELDEEGWVSVDDLLTALHEKGGAWTGVDRDRLAELTASSSKRRHELEGDRVRALYGHSVPGAIAKIPAPPPPVLFHGTASAAWPGIRLEGLRPMRRQYVHLSVDLDTSWSVGRRKSSSPIVLQIHAASADLAGIAFFRGNEKVWLTKYLPPRFIVAVTGERGQRDR
jgi:putative RNA 2'-phosphotransferase